MKKTLLTLAAVACLGLSANAQWTKVTDISELKYGVEYIIGAPNLGWVMTTNDNNSDNYYRLGAEATFNEGSIEGTPANTAIFTVERCGSDYALKQTNAGQTGYLTPMASNQRSIGLSQSPVPLSFTFMTAAEAAAKIDDSGKGSVFSEGDLELTCTSQSTHNLLGIFKNVVDGTFTNTFQFLEQNDQPIALYKKMGQTGTDLPNYVFSCQGQTFDSFNSFTLTFENVKSVEMDDNADTDMVTMTRNGQPFTPTPNSKWTGNPMAFNYREPLTTPGQYVITYEPGVFNIVLNDGTKIKSPELKVTFNIASQEATYFFNLDDNAEVESIESFTLTFNNVEKLATSDDADNTYFTVTRDGVKVDTPNYKDTNPVTFSYREALTEPGLYVFTWKAGLFDLTMSDGSVQASQAMTLSLRIKSDRPLTYVETNPVDGAEIKEFTNYQVIFPEASTVALSNDAAFTMTKDGDTSTEYTGLTLSGVSGNTVTFIYNERASQTTLDEGTYTITFDEGSFLLNGNTKSEKISTSFTINPNLVVGASIQTLITAGMQNEYQPLYTPTSDYGMNEIIMFLASGSDVSINKACSEKIVMKQNGVTVGEIAATNTWRDNTFAEVGVQGGFSAGQSLTLQFAMSNPFEAGKYEIAIPDNFFIDGDEYLQGCTLHYCIGLGDYVPVENSTVNLASPSTANEKSVIDGELARIYLTPYYSQIQLNDYYQKSDDNGVVSYTIDGVEASAILYRVDGKNKVQVAEFPLNTPAVAVQRGDIVFNLSQNGNSPINKNGEYELFFPYNYFRVVTEDSATGWKEFDWTGFTSEELESGNVGYSYTFTVTGGRDADAPDQLYTYTPGAGEYYPFPAVEITYTDGCNNIIVNDGAKATLYYNSAKTTVKGTFTITAVGNVVTLTPDAPITDRQAYDYLPTILDIPANSYNLVYNGKEYANYAIEITDIKVGENPEDPRKPEISVTTFKVVDDIKVITLTFAEPFAGTGTFKNPKLYRVDNLTRANSTANQVGYYAYAKNADNTVLTLTLNENNVNTHLDQIVPGGVYELEVPDGIVYWMNGTTRANFPKTTFTLTMEDNNSTGVDGIEADNTLYTVYTITGIRVLNNADADALKALQPGMYIVNGKKVIVK